MNNNPQLSISYRREMLLFRRRSCHGCIASTLLEWHQSNTGLITKATWERVIQVKKKSGKSKQTSENPDKRDSASGK